MFSPLNKAKLLVNILLLCGVAPILLALIFILGPIYEGKWFPVTSGVTVKHLRNDDGRMLFQAYGTKERNCKLTDIKARVDEAGSDEYQKSVIYVVNDGVGDLVRPLGKQDLGIWAVIPISKKVEVQAWYNCHSLWQTYQVLGTWEEPKGKK